MAWHAKGVVRFIYGTADVELASEFVHLATDLRDREMPPEVRSLGGTLERWHDQIAKEHRAHVSHGPRPSGRG